ncbi:MAG: hypothetical protein SH819_13120 [Cytophagales bacterium]|nr:hypothetical protein [Cytophagales bacterium]
MVLRSLAVLGLLCIGTLGFAQETEPVKKKTKRPDIPGAITVEFGFNFKNGVVPADFQKSWWGSRTVNFYYSYQIRLFKSPISFNPGIGLSLERFKFSNNFTLPFSPDADGTYPLVPATDIYPGTVQRSFIVNNFIEAPIEFRYDSKPDDIVRSLSVSLGMRFGLLYDSFTKVDYTHNGEDKSMKDKQWHGMNRYRQAIYGRVGYGGFGLSLYYNTTPLFAPGKGPEATGMNTITVTMSVTGF